MTIHFQRLADFKELLEKVFTANPTETLTATNSVLLEQVSQDTTQVTTLEPGRAIFVRQFDHAGTNGAGEAGTKLLIDQDELRRKVSKFNAAGLRGSLTLRKQKGTLVLAADLVQTADQRERDRGTASVRQYPGALSDFGPLLQATHLVATLDGSAFNHLIVLLADFGDFSSERRPEGNAVGRSVLFDLIATPANDAAGQLQAMTNFKGAYVAYTCVTQSAQVFTSQRFGIEGRFLKRLLKLAQALPTQPGQPPQSQPVSIYKEEINGNQWVTFASGGNATTLRCVDPEHRFLMDYTLFSPHPKLQERSQRQLSVADFNAGIKLQQPGDTDQQQDLLVFEAPPYLQIMQAGNIQGTDRSNAEYNPTQLKGEWQALLLNSKALAATTKVITHYLTRLRVACTTLTLQQRSLVKQSGNESWLLYVQPTLLDPQLALTTLILARALETSLDQIEVNE